MVTRHYSDELRRGYVVASTYIPPNSPYAHYVWFYGLNSGFGTTFGGLDDCVVVYSTREAAEAVAARIPTAGKHYQVQTLTEARMTFSRQRARVERT